MSNSFRSIYKQIKIVFVLGCFIAFQHSVFSQTNNTLVPKVNIPTSPEAAMMARFGDIPVGYYTGTANISIPLYNIKEGDVEIPITLNYHSSGIKVADEATWVGLGWDLSPGGAIIQEVRGIKDELDNNLNQLQNPQNYLVFKSNLGPIQTGAHYSAFQTGDCLKLPWNPASTCGYSSSDAENILYRLREGHGQPDIYNYNFNGHAGKFYINPETKQPVLMDKKESIYFEKLSNGWKATTLDGTIFLFQVIETANAWVTTNVSGITYKLSNISLLNGRSINFSYTDEQSVTEFHREAEVFGQPPFGQSYYVRDHTYSNKKTLASITTSDAIINFNLENRDDIISSTSNNIKRLKSIDVKSIVTNKKIKSYQFGYSYFPYSLLGAPTFNGTLETHTAANINGYGKRLKLDFLKEVGYTDSEVVVLTKPAHQFSYDLSSTMPLKNSYAVDFWGYYNGEGNNKLLPDLSYFDYINDVKYVDQPLFSYPYTGANRYTNNNLAGIYMLKKITYPTGGYTEFEYEPNSFTNQFIPDKTSNVFKSWDIHDNSISTTGPKQFKLSKTTTLHFENSIRNGAGNYNGVTPLTATQMAACYIEFYKTKVVHGVTQTTIIKRWDLTTVLNVDFNNNGGKTWNEELRVIYDSDPTLNYHIRLDFPNSLNNTLFASIAGVSSHVTYYDDTNVDITVSNQCGMRVKSIKNYTSTGNIASHKTILYSEGKLLNKFEPLETVNAVHNNMVQLNTYTAFYKRTSISSDDFGAYGGNLIGYGKVEEVELSQSEDNIGKKTFFFINNVNQVRKGYPNSPYLKNGLLSKEQIFDNMQNMLLERDYVYSNLSPFSCYSGIIIKDHVIGNSDWPSHINVQNNPYVGQFNYKFSYGVYPLISEWNKLQSVTTKQFSGINFLTTSETYTYNTEGKISTITNTNSKNESLIIKYYYPIDNMINTYTDNYMQTVHNTGTPVITEQYNGTKLLSRQRIVYGSYPNAPTLLPQYIFAKKGSNTEEKKVTIDSYDNKGNITQYTEENNIPVSFVWSQDKTVPLTKIENATYSSLLALPNGLNANFRTALPNAFVTSYTYKPLIGVSTITQPNGKVVTYEYDDFNSLNLIRDEDNNILKKICYNFSGQIENCSSLPTVAVNSTNSISIPYTITLINTTTSIVYTYSIVSSSITLEAGTVPTGNYNIQITPTNSSSQNVQLIFNGVTQTGTSFTINNTIVNGDINLTLSSASYTGSCSFSLASGWGSQYTPFYSSGTDVNFSLVIQRPSYGMYTVYTVGTVAVGCRPSVVRSLTWLSSTYSTWNIKIYPSGEITIQLISGPVPPSYTYLSINNLNYSL